jgi:hypothetical protein
VARRHTPNGTLIRIGIIFGPVRPPALRQWPAAALHETRLPRNLQPF